ncbi:MAG TPA: polyphosphate kinase 2, partial [Sphingomicrobium sp.]
MSGKSELSNDEYEELLEPMARELSAMARWVSETGQRLIVIFEGRDTAGKGGSIDMIARLLNPRQCRVIALPSPSEREKGQWYFQRYIEHLPATGEITLFDRSWYNRAGVERVMGYTDKDEVERFLEDVPKFERWLVESGVILIKLWLEVGMKEQDRRFRQRIDDPIRQWKLS